MDMTVFIHTNDRQWLGAEVAKYALRRNSAHTDKFDVRIINVNDFPYLAEKEAKKNNVQ